VTLKEWIEKRCGGDFDLVLDGRNQNCIGHVGALKPEVVAQSHATHVSFSWHVLPMLATERHHLNDSYAFLQNALAPAKAYLEWPYHIYMTYCSSVFSVVPALSFTDVVERSVLSSVRCKAVRS